MSTRSPRYSSLTGIITPLSLSSNSDMKETFLQLVNALIDNTSLDYVSYVAHQPIPFVSCFRDALLSMEFA